MFLLGCGGLNPSKGDDDQTDTGDSDLDNGGITGSIYASGSTAISGAIAEAADRQAITASDGRYLLTQIPAGDYQVIARARGYFPQTRDAVRVYTGKITESVDFTLSDSAATATVDFAVIGLQPAFGTDGDLIGVYGRGFGPTRGRVTVAGKEASILDWNSQNDGLITIKLPAEVETGQVIVYVGSEASHESQPVIFTAKPIALEASPSSAKPGAMVSIIGRNFHQIAAFNKVTLNNLTCQVLSAPTTRRLNILVPQNAETGTLQVRIEGNEYQLDGISTAVLTIPPEIIYLSPKRSIPGITLSIYGYNFGTDKSIFKIYLGDKKILTGTDIISLTKNKVTFPAPDGTVVEPGKSIEISVAVNDAKSNSVTYTAYNTAQSTLSAYGIYDFTTVSTANTLKLASLPATDRVTFLSVFSGNGALDLGGNFNYVFSSYLGGNFTAIPTLPVTNTTMAATRKNDFEHLRNHFDAGPMIRSWSQHRKNSGGTSVDGLRFLTAAAPASTTFWMVNFVTGVASDTNNDVLATGTLTATGTHCLVYLDTATDTVITASDTEKIATWFDATYETLATACWDGVSSPPEGNIDAQSRIILFVTPQINRGSTSNLDILGYFNPRDKDLTETHSAGTEILYLWDKKFNTSPDDFKGLLAHELQHMMYYNQKGLQGVTWIDEGLSNFAQQIIGYGFPQNTSAPVSQVSSYLRAPHTISLNHWPDDAGLANYGMSYLFVQYIFERCSGYTAIRALERKSGSVGFPDIETNIILGGITTVSTSGIESFIHEFALAMYCDDLGIADTLSGNKPAIYKFGTLGLRGTISGISGLRHLAYGESPISAKYTAIMGYGCDVIEYYGGNGGDLEVTIVPPITTAGFKTWVIYYPAQ